MFLSLLVLEECWVKDRQTDKTGPLSLIICVTERLEIIDGRHDKIELLRCEELMQAIRHLNRRLLYAWH